MVRETRYLLVGNLPEKVSEEAVLDHFKRYGKIQSVKLHKKESEEGLSATVAFGDIKSASKAYGSENRIEGNLLTTEYSEGSVSGSAVTRIVEPPPVRPSSYSRQFPGRSKGSEDGESFEGRDFHYSPGQYEGRYSQGGGGGGGGYGEEGYQRGRPRERFVARGAFKQYDVRGGYHGRPSYKDQSSQDGFEKPKVPQSPAHSTSHSSSRHSSKRKRKKKKHVSRSESRSRSRSSSSSSSSRSSSDSSGSRSSSGSSRSSSHKRKSQSRSGHIKSYRTESQDSIGSDHGGSKSDLDKTRGVLIKNLPLRSSDTSLRDGLFHDFKKYGKINAVLVTGQGEDRYAIVSYRKTEDAEKAIHNTQGKVFFGMKIRTSLTDGIEVDDNELRPPEAELDEHHPKATRTLFVGNLEKDISNEELRERFSKFGTILDIDVKRQGAISAYAFVQFTDISSVVKVLRELEGEIWGSMKLKLGFGKSMPTTCVWLDNVDQTVQENFLCRQFMRYGQVSHGIIDRIRGRALVFFVNLEMAQYALNEMRNRILNNRKIIIDFASRDCQTEFYEKMEKTGQLKPGMRPDERRGWMYNRQGPDGQWEATYDNRGSFYKFPYHQGPPQFRGRGRGWGGSRGGFNKEGFSGEEYRRTRSYEEYGRYPGGPPEGDFDQDLRAYQRERREHGSPSPSQYSDDPYGERYGKYFKYPESYRSGSPVSERAYEDFEYGKPRPDEKYFKERYPEMEFHDRHGYSPEGRSWSRSPTLGMPPKDSYGRNTPPTPMDDEMHDFSSHDNSPEGEAIGKYSEVKEKRRKSGDDFMINEADIAEINRASKYHAGYRKGQESPWRDERYDRKRSYDESFSNEFGQFEQSPHKLDRQISRGSKSSIADSRRDICQKVRKIESKITERLKKGKESSPSSGSSESGELTEGELTKLQSEKQLLLDKLKSLEKDSSNSDLEEGMIEEDRRKSSKRPRLESENPWEKSSKNELTNAKGHPKKSVSYDSTLSLRKQMDHLRKIDETKKTEEKNRNYASNASRTSVDAEGSEAEEFTAMLSPKEISASFKRRKKHETAEEKRSYRLKRGDEEMSSDNEENKNPSRTDSLSSNPVFRRMSSGHSSPRTPVVPHGHDPSGDVLRHSESDLSANEGHSSFTDDSKKKSESATKNHGHRSKHRQKEEHQPTVIPLGDDEPNSELSDPRSRNVISEQMSLPLPQFAELDLNVMMSPDAENSEERMKSESPCFSPPSSGSKNTNSPQRSPSESVSADSQEPIQPEYIPEEGTTNEVPSEEQLLGKTKEKSDFDSDDGFSDNSDHMDNFESDDKLSLEERIRRLDEKLRAVPTPSTSTKPVSDISASLSINSGSKGEACNSSLARTALYSKFRISKRQDASGNGIDNKAEGSDITHTVVPRKISIFDQDAKRLEQISEKYSPKTNLSSVEDTHVSMPVMTKAAVKEMPLATLPGSLTGRLGNSAAFPTLSVNTTTANQTGLKPEEMFSSPTSEISTPSPAFNSSQEKPIWQTENFTGSPHLVEPAVTAYSLVPKTNFSEQINNSGNLHSNSSKEDLISKPFVTPAVKKQMGLSNLSDANSVFTNSVVHEEKLHSPKESEKLSPKGDAKSSPNRNEQTVSPKLSPKPFSKMDSNVNSFVETNSSIKSDLISDLHTSDSNKLTNSMDKVNSHSVQSVNEPMEEDTPSILCDTKSNSAPRTKNSDPDVTLSNHVSDSHVKKTTENKENSVTSKFSESCDSLADSIVTKQDLPSTSVTRDSSISKVNGSKDHNKKVNETVEDVLGLNTPVLGKRKAELDEKPKNSSKDKSSSKETVPSVNMTSESELSEKDDKTQEPDVKKVKLAKSESSSSEGEKVDGKNKVKNKDSQKKDKENKKKEACEDDLVKKEKNNGEKKDKDRDGSSSKGSASKTSSSSGEKTGSSSKSSSKSHDKSQAASKSSSVKAEDKVVKPSTDKNKSSKSDDKSKADGKSESKSKSDDKTKTEKSSDGTTKKQSDKKSEHKKEHKSSSSAKTSDVTKVKDKDKSAKDGQKGKSKDDQASGSKSVKSEKTGHGNSDKSTKDGVNKNKKESSEKSKGEGCKPKEEQKERSQSFDSPSKSKDPPQQDTKERSQSMTESEKVKDKSNSSNSDTSKESTSKPAEGKSSSEKEKSKHTSPSIKSAEKSRSKEHSKTKVKDRQSSSDKTAKDDNKDKSGVKADDSSDRKSEVKAEQKTEQHTEAKSEQKTDSSENKSGNGDKSSDKSDKNGDKGGDKSGDKSGNSDGKQEMKGFGSDDRKHEKKKSSHSDSSKSFKKSEKSSSEKSEKSSSEKSEKSSSEKSQKSSSHKMPSKSEFDKDKDKSQKNDREKSKGHSSSSSLSEKEKEKKLKSSEKAKKVEKENKEVKTVSTSSSKKKPETPAVQTMKSPEYSKKPPVEDDFDWDAWQEPYVSMYDKVKRRSTIKDQERERERELEKTRERLDKLQEKRQNKKASKQKSGKPNFRSDYTESEFTDEDDITGKSKKKSSSSNNNKKKAPQIYSSSSESDYDFEEPLFPSQKKAQAKPKVQSIPKKKKKASILDIYSSDSEESSDSSFGIPRSVNKKKPKTPKRDQSMESDDVFGLKQKPVEIKKKPKKETPQKPTIKSPARKNFNEIFSSSDSDSDTDPAIQESPKPVQRSKSVKDKLDKPGNKIYSSSESDSMDEMFTPPKKMVLTESTKEKASKNIKTPKKHDNNNKKKPNNIFDDGRAFKGLVTTQTVSETDLPITGKGETLFGSIDNFTDNGKKEKSAKNIRKKEKEDILVGEGKLEIGKKQIQEISLFEKMDYHKVNKDEKEVSVSSELKSAEKKSKDSSEKSKKKKESKKRKEPTFEKKSDKSSSTSLTSNTNNVSDFEKGIVFGDNEKIENDVIVEEVPIDDSFLVETPVHDENARNMWDSSDEIPRGNCVDKAETNSNRTKLDSQGESLSVSDNSEKLGSTPKSKKSKDKLEGDSPKKSKKKDKVDKEGKVKRKKKKQRISNEMDQTIDDVSKGKDLLKSGDVEPEMRMKDKADGASSEHSDVDLDFSTPLFGNFVPAIIKPARPSLKEKEKAVLDKEAERNPMSLNKENELDINKILDKSFDDKSGTDGEKGVDSLSSPNPDISSPEVKHTLEKVLDRKKEISSKTALLERTEVGQEKMKFSFDSDIESGLKSTDKLGLKFDGAQEKKVITPPKDTLVNLSTSNKDDMPAMLGLPSPPLPKNGSLIPTTQPSAILKSQIPQSIKHGKPGSKTMAEDGKKNMLKKPNSAFRKTKGTDVFEFKEDDSDLMEPLNFKHRHSDVDKAKSGSENKTHAGHNEVSDKASSNDNTSKPKPAFSWDIPSWDKFTRRDSDSKPKPGVHHEQESLFANWAKSLTEVKVPAASVENALDTFKGCNKKQPRKKVPQKQPAKTPPKSDIAATQPTKASEEKEGNGNKEDLARDNFGFDLLTKDIEDPSKREAKEKTPAPKDRQEETLEAVSSLQSLADNDKDQLSEDDALVIDESDNTTAPEAATVTSPENVPPQADSETALAIQSILSFDDQEKPTEQEVPTPVEAEPIITPAENATVPTPASVPTPQSFDAVPTVPAAEPQQEVPSVPDVPIKTAEQTHVDSQVPAFETRPEALHTVRHEQNSFPEVPVAEPPIVTPTKAKKQRNNRRRKTSKSPVQGPYPSFQENSEDRFDLHNREDSDDGVLHIATESPNPETIEPQVSSIADVSNTAIDVALTDKDLQQKPLTPLHISLNGASIPEKPERQSRSRRKKNAKTAEVPQPLPETPIQHQHAETNVLAEIGSPDMASEKTDLSISDSERTDDGDASFGDEGIDGKRPRRGARKPKNYKELSGITPRTNSPRSRTSPRSPRGASPKAEIASPVVKIERLPNVAKNQREDEEQGVKDLVSNKEVPAVKEAPRRGRSSATMETGEIQHKATNVFDFDANEAEEKSESCAAPVPKRRSSSRRKKGSSEGLDGTVLTSEIKETGIKISIARQPAGLQRNNSQDHNKEKVAEAKKPVPQPCEAKPVKDIPNALPPLVIEPEKKAMKPRDMMNAEARSRSNSMVREEPISITIPKSKIIPSLPAPSTAVVTMPSTTQSTTMSNIDRIIDNVSKGIFDWNDVDDSTAQQNKLTTPLTIDVGVMDKKRAATRNHTDDMQHLKSPQLVSPIGHGALKSPCTTTMSVVSPMTAGQQMAGLKSPHRDLMKHGPSLQSPLPGVHGNIESAAHKAMIEESNRMMAPPTVGSSPIQTQASPIVTLANKFDSHFNHVMGARFPPPMSAHAANTTVVMTTSNSPLVSTGMSSAAQQEMVLNMSKHAPSSVAMTTAAPVSEAATVLSTAGNARSVISSSHSHVPPPPANDKFQQPEPVTTTSSSAIGEKRSNSLDRVQQSVTSAPTCVVHPITTTSLTSKQQQDAQAAQMMQLRMAEPRLNQIQALFHGDPKALEGLGKEQLCALMERGIPPFMHPMTDQHIIQHMANQKALFEMQKHQESVVKHHKGRNQKNPDPVKESQRPPSAHSNPKQGERLLLDQFNFPPMAFQEQIRAHYSKGPYGPQMWAHLQHLQNLKQLEEKNKMHAAVDPKTTSPSMLHQPSSVIAATVASQHGQHPQIKSPALAQTAPSPHQVGPTFTQAHSLQRPPSPQTGKKGSDKVPHNNRWPEANIIPAHEGQRSRPPSHDAERASPRDHWAYGQAPKPAHQHQDSVPMSQKERLMQRQKEEQHQREMQMQQEMQREKEKKHQELQWQLEERARQEAAAPAHSQGRRESNASSLPNQPTDLRQTALVPGQQRVPGQADEKMVDPRFGQHPGMGFPADLRRPSSQNPGGFPQPVSAAELSPGVNAHLTPEMQRRYQERVLAMGHHMQIDPLHMQQLLAQGLRPHFLPGGGIQVDHPALSEGRPPSQSSHRGENSQGHGPANQIPSDGPMMHMHEAPMHGIPPRPPVHDGPPGGEGSLLSSLQRYPVMWQGVLALKNDQCVVQLHLINGFNQLVKMSLPQTSPDGTVQPLRIAQRMRLEAAQLEGVVKRMQFDKDYCMLLALPCGRNHEDIISQTRAMASGFIQYLQQKQAAGIVNVPEPESLQPAYVVHIFPPCEFSHNTLGRLGFDLLHQVRDLAHLLVIITTVA